MATQTLSGMRTAHPITPVVAGTVITGTDGTAGGMLASAVRTFTLTVPEASKNTDHTSLGLVDWILPKPTNSSGDYAAFHAAVIAAPNGARYLMPQGTYSFTSTPGIPAGCEVHGSGRGATYGTVLKMANAANLDAVICDAGWQSASTTPAAGAQTSYYDFTVDGNRTNQTSGLGHGLVTFTQGAMIERVEARNTIGDGICVASGTQAGFGMTGSCNEVKVAWCHTFNCGGAGIHFDEFNAVAKLTDGFVSKCVCDGNSNGDYGILIDGFAGHLVTGNHIYAVKKDSIRCDRAFSGTIDHNYMEGFGVHATPGSYYAINCDTVGMQDHASLIIDHNRIVTPITNPATGTALFGIGVLAASSISAANVVITGNVLRGRTWTTATTAILVHNTSGTTVTNVVEKGNIITEAWDVPITIGSALTINLTSGDNTGQDRLSATTFSATPTLLPARVEAAGGWLMTLTGNVTAMTMTAGRDGQEAVITFVQDGTGSRTVVWPTNSSGMAAPASAASSITTQKMRWISALTKWVKVS